MNKVIVITGGGHGIGAATASLMVRRPAGKPQGGFAWPLESYPAEVWRTFMFQQIEVAKRMGATPNIVSDGVRQTLFDPINRSRSEPGTNSSR